MMKFIPAFLWAFFVAFLCLLPQSALYNPTFLQKLPVDKIVHFGMFFILSMLVWMGSLNKLIGTMNFQVVLILLILISYGGVTEIAQEFLTRTRHAEFLDFVFDIIGVASAFFICLIWAKRKLPSAKEIKY